MQISKCSANNNTALAVLSYRGWSCPHLLGSSNFLSKQHPNILNPVKYLMSVAKKAFSWADLQSTTLPYSLSSVSHAELICSLMRYGDSKSSMLNDIIGLTPALIFWITLWWRLKYLFNFYLSRRWNLCWAQYKWLACDHVELFNELHKRC